MTRIYRCANQLPLIGTQAGLESLGHTVHTWVANSQIFNLKKVISLQICNKIRLMTSTYARNDLFAIRTLEFTSNEQIVIKILSDLLVSRYQVINFTQVPVYVSM